MIFKKVENKLRDKWKYQITLIDIKQLEMIKLWCSSFVVDYEFVQNSFYVNDLDMAYKFRIQFDRLVYRIQSLN
jgi:hypothetical protein